MKTESLHTLGFVLLLSTPVWMSTLNSCGGGNIMLDQTAGNPSILGTNPSDDDQATSAQYFTDNLYPIMKATSGAGCASNSCHGTDSSNASTITFFQIDRDSAENTLKWASVRRTTVQIGTYASSSSLLLKTRKDTNHPNSTPPQGFQAWTDEQKAMLDTWAGLSQ